MLKAVQNKMGETAMFTGYSEKTLDFMWGIRFNNNREWFTAHKNEYLQHLYNPPST